MNETQLAAERDRYADQCRAYEEQITALTNELAETNHGVVAL